MPCSKSYLQDCRISTLLNRRCVCFAGNSDLDSCPSIASFRPGSVALTSDQLMPGDRIYSVNGITTNRMRADEVTTLLDNVDGNAVLEIEYSLPNYGKWIFRVSKATVFAL